MKYNAGNVFSVVNALRRLGVTPLLTDSPKELLDSDKIIFPGQGEAGHAMAYLHEHKLDECILRLEKPVLGICLGQQLLCKHSEEGDTDCLGIIDAPVLLFKARDKEDKIPVVGWNDLYSLRSPLMEGLGDRPYVYFTHSYYVPQCKETIAMADYTVPYSAALQKDNFFATQFHPEKSGSVGERILRNFLEL